MYSRSRVSKAAFLIAGSLGAFSTCQADQWVSNLTATQVIAASAGASSVSYVQIVTSEAVNNPAGCQVADSYMVQGEQQPSALAIVLAAIQSNKHLRVLVSGIECAATGRPLVTAVGLL